MSLKPNSYRNRLIDKKIEDYLSVAGAISIEGPKWCGKTWTSLAHAKTIFNMDNDDIRNRFELNSDLLLNDEKPILIDEWTNIPSVWDKVRRKCDELQTKGNYILSCSTKADESKIFHSGAGRIVRIRMDTMSLYESGDSSGLISIMDMYNGKKIYKNTKETSLEELANLIIRGGWPANINISKDKIGLMPKMYINSILKKDISDNFKIDISKFNLLLKSLARNESTLVSNKTLITDIYDRDDISIDRSTIDSYLNILNNLYLISNQPSYSSNYRSRNRVGKSEKRHYVDPSIPAALLDLNSDKLLKDLKTFGFLFEALVERDLRIYMESLDGKLYHFRDNISGLEVDSILEFPDGEYAAVEIKLGFNGLKDGENNLIKFRNNTKKKPRFMCVICGYSNVIGYDKENDIYTLPITALKP